MIIGLMLRLLTLYVLFQYRRHRSKKLRLELFGLRGSGEPIYQVSYAVTWHRHRVTYRMKAPIASKR